jgi:group I intron endonuclease
MNDKKVYGVIYKIRIRLKIYVGKTKDYNSRISQHKSDYKNSKRLMYEDMRIVGWENCQFNILQYCYSNEELHNEERYFIDKLDAINNGYNKNSVKYKKLLSEKQKAISEKMKLKQQEFYNKHGYYQFQKKNQTNVLS